MPRYDIANIPEARARLHERYGLLQALHKAILVIYEATGDINPDGHGSHNIMPV